MTNAHLEMKRRGRAVNTDTIDTYVAKQRHFYDNQVKPHLDRGDSFAARVIFGNVIDNLLGRRLEIEAHVHCGIRYIACGIALYEDLKLGRVDRDAVRRFEVFAAQTRLPGNDN